MLRVLAIIPTKMAGDQLKRVLVRKCVIALAELSLHLCQLATHS